MRPLLVEGVDPRDVPPRQGMRRRRPARPTVNEEDRMPNRDDLVWFKQTFAGRIVPALADTPLTLDLIVALACQETGFVWSKLRRDGLSEAELLALCVGDTIDARADGSGRPFPKHRADLLTHPRGAEMFAIARAALVEMAAHIPGYERSVANPDKFCHGFGLFQRDLQHFPADPDYFLDRRWARFEQTLEHCTRELRRCLHVLGVRDATRLDDERLAQVAIVYNTGRFRPERGLRQGHFDGQRYYGESVLAYLRLAKTVPVAGMPGSPLPRTGEALLPPPSPLEAGGGFYRVETHGATLRLRSQPKRSQPPRANVVAALPDGHPVRAFDDTPTHGFLDVETSLYGARLRGFASADHLVRDDRIRRIPVLAPSPTPPTRGFVAVHLPAPAGTAIRRRAPAGPQSLDEPGQPGRQGDDPAALRRELAAIVEWLGCDDPAHLRYAPRDGAGFAAVYAHDYCHLAGVYLPRVWWTDAALARIALGAKPPPLLGNTVREMGSDDLARWLRDFGAHFGWRRTGSVSSLQREADQGAVALIAAEGAHDGRGGHLAIIVPETPRRGARRNAAGEVIAPLQSQAGAAPMRCGTGTPEWWKDPRYADAAFWMHG